MEKMAQANAAVGKAKRNGQLVPEGCCVCGSRENIHAHHENYDEPLEVIWYCAKHHKQRHVEIGDVLVDGKSGKTTTVSLRISEDLLNEIDSEAKRLGVSRNWVINRKLEKLPPLYSVDRESGKVSIILESEELVETVVGVEILQGTKPVVKTEMQPRKKIAVVSVSGGAEGDGGTPSLPRGGKAQVLGYGALNAEIADKVLAENGLHLPTSGFGGRNIYYGRPTSETPPGTEVVIPLKPRSEGLSRLAAKKIAAGSVPAKLPTPEVLALAEEFKKVFEPEASEVVDEVEGRGAAGEDRRNSETVPEDDNGVEGVAVGVGKPKVNQTPDFNKLAEDVGAAMKADRMAALRDICAGNIPPATIIVDSRVLTEVVGGYIDLGTMPVCVACDGPLEESRGKLACPDESCGKYGQVQKGKCKRGERVDG
jgi:hypothetical protein